MLMFFKNRIFDLPLAFLFPTVFKSDPLEEPVRNLSAQAPPGFGSLD